MEFDQTTAQALVGRALAPAVNDPIILLLNLIVFGRSKPLPYPCTFILRSYLGTTTAFTAKTKAPNRGF